MKKLALLLMIAIPATAFAQGTNTIAQKGRRFLPAEISIRQGQSITVTNEDEFIHQIYSEGLFDSEERRPGQNIVESFPRSGTFEVRCHIHPKMKLIVRVN
ncbi:MAG: cupredoxin domain-containing protein [Pseudomonadota bacterium]